MIVKCTYPNPKVMVSREAFLSGPAQLKAIVSNIDQPSTDALNGLHALPVPATVV